MKEEFILPKKWFIERTKDNCKEINSYFNTRFNTNYFNQDSYLGINESIGPPSRPAPGSGGFFLNAGYTQITTEQFRKYVLGFEIENNKPIEENMDYLILFLQKLNIK